MRLLRTLPSSSLLFLLLLGLAAPAAAQVRNVQPHCMHSPLWAQPGEEVTIRLSALDADQRLTTADRYEIWVDSQDAPALFLIPKVLPGDVIVVPPTLTHRFTPSGDRFEYGCKVFKDGEETFSGWRVSEVGRDEDQDNVRVLYQGSTRNHLDVVFFADINHYGQTAPGIHGTDPDFIADAETIVRDAVMGLPVFFDNLDLFNFWLAMGPADYSENAGCSIALDNDGDGRVDYTRNDPPLPPPAQFADARAVVVPIAMGGSCWTTNGIGTPASSVGTTRHELGHMLFHLSDEYPAARGVFEKAVLPNAYRTRAGCEADAPDVGRTGNDCHGFAGTWFTSDPEYNDLMVDNRDPQALDLRRMHYVFGLCRDGNCDPAPATVAAALPVPAAARPPSNPGSAPIPSLDPLPEVDALQTVVAIDADGQVTTSTRVVRGPVRPFADAPPFFEAHVYDETGGGIASRDLMHPLYAFWMDADGNEQLVEVEEGSITITTPFAPEAAEIVVLDRTGDEPVEVTTVDARPAVRAFCGDDPSHPDCEASDLELVEVGVRAGPGPLLVGEESAVTVRTVVANRGPTAPADGGLVERAIPSPGIWLEPLETESEQLGLAIDAPRMRDLDYRVRCDAPGATGVTFESRIALLGVAVGDPVPENDRGDVFHPIDCLNPVAVWIQPSINPRSRQIQARVLSNGRGRYGLPANFDVAAIDPASVRLGTRERVLAGGGAPAYRRGKSRAMLSFEPARSGLTEQDDEACLLGSYRTAAGGVARFLGCSPVRIVP